MVCPKSLTEPDTGNLEVVRREAFALDESGPAMVFDYSRKGSVTFNKACLDALGDPEYVLLLINTEKKVFVLQRWRKIRRRERLPRGYKVERNEKGAYVQEECLLFLTKMAGLMDWETGLDSRIRICGKRTDSNLVVFDLAEAVMYTGGTDGNEAEEPAGECSAVETAAS